MDPDHSTDTRRGAKARYTLDQHTLMNARRYEKLSRRRRLPNYNIQSAPGPQQSIQWTREDTEVDNANCAREDEKTSSGDQDTAIPAVAKFSDKKSLAQLRKRHDELAACIEKMKEDIAKHPKTLEKEVVLKSKEETKEAVKQKVSSADDDEIDIDIRLG